MKMPPSNLYGLATGIGSMPFTDPDDALNLIFTYFKEIPHWPQLPRRGPGEGLAPQYLAPLLKHGLIAVHPNGTPYFCLDDPQWEKRCLDYYELLLTGESAIKSGEFAFAAESAAGFYAFLERCARQPLEALYLKGQIAGPITVGFRVTDPAGKPSFYDPTLREIIVKTLAAAACWQVRQLQALGRPVIIFVDEPGLYNYGSSTAVALGRPEIEASLEEIFTAVRSAGGITGLHSCAGTDWSLLTGLSLDLINFDAYEYFPSLLVYGAVLDPFFARGGALAWGIVPASDKVLQEDLSSLQRLLESQMEALVKQGAGEPYVRSRYLITPACGTGTLSKAVTERIYRLTASLAERIS